MNLLGAVTGWKDFSAEEAMAVGERVVNLQRIFNLRQGFNPRRDFEDIGQRLLEAPPDGVVRDKPLAPHLETMIREYYGFMGWSERTGKPLGKTLERSGLADFA